MSVVRLIFLLLVANGAPVLARRLLGARLACPLDGGLRLADHRPLLGRSKTVRGVTAALLVTPAAALAVGLGIQVGLLVAGSAMAGDLLASFVKRRLGIAPSGRALGLDQIPESLLPALAVQSSLHLGPADVLTAVAGFTAAELLLSRILYQVHLRKRPY